MLILLENSASFINLWTFKLLSMNILEFTELEKAKPHITVKIIEYLPIQKGEGIIIPTHLSHIFNANEQFKMLSTVIKNGYDV